MKRFLIILSLLLGCHSAFGAGSRLATLPVSETASRPLSGPASEAAPPAPSEATTPETAIPETVTPETTTPAISETESRTEIRVGFRVGSSAIDPSLGENAARLSEIVSLLERIGRLGPFGGYSTMLLTEVRFSGYASPEGGYTRNRQLAAARLRALETYVRDRVALPDSVVTRHEGGIAWDCLAELVENSDIPYIDETLHVLRDVPEFVYDRSGRLTDSRKKQLMDLRGGRTWHTLAARFFAPLRNACTILVTVKHVPQPVAPAPELPETPETAPAVPVQPEISETPAVQTPAADTLALRQLFEEQERNERRGVALKTNLLYDVLAVPNIGVEVSLGRKWSFSADWMYGWWSRNASHRYWRIYGGEIAVRKWFGRLAAERSLAGHHVGLYGQIFTYDFELGGKGYMGGRPGSGIWEKLNYAAGIEYGYSLPVARRLHLDFTVGIGYWGGKYYEYEPLEGHYVWLTSRNRRWFGPTKAEISLVWLLGRGNGAKNSDKTKGGAK